MIEKLQQLEVPAQIIRWIFDFLSDRPLSVKVADSVSPVLITNTGAPQGCVLSPFLYITYTNDSRCNNPDCSCFKFADDSAILALLSDDNSLEAYQDTVDSFSQWCDTNFLELNVSKTKELVIDPRRGDHPAEPVKVNGQNVEVMDSFSVSPLILSCLSTNISPGPKGRVSRDCMSFGD